MTHVSDVVPRLALRSIGKQFGGIAALTDVSFDIGAGRVHALLGENGAGKSTLVKIVTGVQPADTGSLSLDGDEVRFASPMEARATGVVAMYQDPRLFPHLDVAENIFMGAHPMTALGTVARSRMYERAAELLAAIDADIDVRRRVLGLSIAEAQYVEFARAMSAGDIRLLFLDEPTASLTPTETERLFRIVRGLRDAGASIVFISHRLEELEAFVDELTILRDGRLVLSAPATEVGRDEVVRAMVGRELARSEAVEREPHAIGALRLEVRELSSVGEFADVSFTVRAGEIVAMAGLVGAGRSEVVRTIMGLLPADGGSVRIDDVPIERRSPRLMKALGVAYVPEDRDHDGLVTAHSIGSNLSLASLDALSSCSVIARSSERGFIASLVDKLRIKVSDAGDAASTLSGGNRQKVVIGKWLAREPRVILLDEPTHGIDVGTKAHVHELVRELARRGVAVLIVSSDLPEVLALADSIVVLRQGKVVGVLARGAADEEGILRLATGQEAAA